VEEDGSPVVDRVDKKRMRPLPPAAPGAPLASYALGQQVDVKSNDCWWESVLLSRDGDTATAKINSALSLRYGRARRLDPPRSPAPARARPRPPPLSHAFLCSPARH